MVETAVKFVKLEQALETAAPQHIRGAAPVGSGHREANGRELRWVFNAPKEDAMATVTAPSVDEIRRISEERGIEFYFAQFVDLMRARARSSFLPATWTSWSGTEPALPGSRPARGVWRLDRRSDDC
jgi:hypothetical protein